MIGWNKWLTAIAVIAILTITAAAAGFLLSTVDSNYEASRARVAVIPISGEISAASPESIFSAALSSGDIVGLIGQAGKDDAIDAILLEINSPGGSAVASEEIMDAVKSANKTTVALIRDTGASGAYWIASAADVVVASPISITGSIGVVASYLEFSGLMLKYGVSYQRLVSGDYKDAGSPYRNLTDTERKLLQEQLDMIHIYFITSVAENRNLTVDAVSKSATGMIFTGSRARELGLVDVLGGSNEANQVLKQRLNASELELVSFGKDNSILGSLGLTLSQAGFQLGRGIGSTISEKAAFAVKT